MHRTPLRKADFPAASPGHGDGNTMPLQDALNAFPHVQGKLMFIISPVRAFIGEVSRVMAGVQNYLLLFHSCLPFPEIDQNQIMHISAALDGLAFEITLAGAAAVQHNGGIPSCRRQIVSEGLRRPGHTPAVSRTVQGQRAALDADSGASPLSSLALVINQFGDWLSGNNQRCAGDIITLRGIRQRVHRDVRSLIPGVAEDCVIRFAEYLPICFQVAVWDERGHVIERPVEDVIRPGLPLNLRERPESGVDVKLDAPDVFQGIVTARWSGISTTPQLLENLVCAGSRKAGHNANSRSGDVICGGEVRHEEHTQNTQRSATDTADNGNPFVVKFDSLHALPDQQADDGDCRHTGNAERRNIHSQSFPGSTKAALSCLTKRPDLV